MPVLLDSSIYISAMRVGGDAALLLRRWARESPLWLSSVVLEELYAGAEAEGSRVLEKLERDFEKANAFGLNRRVAAAGVKLTRGKLTVD